MYETSGQFYLSGAQEAKMFMHAHDYAAGRGGGASG